MTSVLVQEINLKAVYIQLFLDFNKLVMLTKSTCFKQHSKLRPFWLASRPLHILLEKRRSSKELPPKKAILLDIMLQKYYYARIMLLQKSIFLGSKYLNMINKTLYRPCKVRLTQHYVILKTNMGNNL